MAVTDMAFVDSELSWQDFPENNSVQDAALRFPLRISRKLYN
jgi:hypothetical protein